jgi:hypothetical protein
MLTIFHQTKKTGEIILGSYGIRDFEPQNKEPQNFEQGIMNIEVIEDLIKIYNSTFLVRYSIFAF